MRAVCVAVFIVALACLTQARPTFQARSLKLADSWKKGDWKKGGCPSWKKDCNGDGEFSFAFEDTTANGFAVSTANAEADLPNNDDDGGIDTNAKADTGGLSFLGSTSGKAAALDKKEGQVALAASKHETHGILAGASAESIATADDDDTETESSASAGVGFAGTASAATIGAAKIEEGEFAISAAKVDVIGKGFGESDSVADDDDGTQASGKSVSKGGHVSTKSFATQRDGIVG